MNKLISLLCFSLAAVTSQAVVAYNTFGPENSTKSFGWGFGDIRDARIASQFTPSVTGTLTTIEMRLQASSTPATATISLFKDSGDDIGALIAEFSSDLTTGGLKTLTNSNPSIELVAGTKYWIEAKSTAGSGLYSGWYINNQGVTGLIKFGSVAGTLANPTSTYKVGPAELTAFRVNVAPVPEPSTLACLAAGSLLMRRRKRASKG